MMHRVRENYSLVCATCSHDSIPSGRRRRPARSIEISLLLSLESEQIFSDEAFVFENFIRAFVNAVVGVRWRTVRRSIRCRSRSRLKETVAGRFLVAFAFLIATPSSDNRRPLARQRRIHRNSIAVIHDRRSSCSATIHAVIKQLVIVQSTSVALRAIPQ